MAAAAPESLAANGLSGWVSEPNLGVLSTTVGTEADAAALATALVERRLAACVHLQSIRSVYAWQGQVQQDAEWALRIKLAPHQLARAVTWLRAHHPYQTPELLWQRCDGAGEDYSRWVADPFTPPPAPLPTPSPAPSPAPD